ncbi:MAG: hypothetical protein ACLRSW_15020 [Christensenellaceae bacterium]
MHDRSVRHRAGRSRTRKYRLRGLGHLKFNLTQILLLVVIVQAAVPISSILIKF